MKRWLLGALVAVLGAGCGAAKQAPEVYPVKGKVVSGAQVITSGFLQFRPVKATGLTTLADIEPAGTFDVVTIFDNRRLRGAPAGAYQVTVHVASGQSRGGVPIELPALVTVETRDNVITIDVAKTGK